MEYKYEIKEIYEKCLNLMPLGMITKHYYQGVIYVEVEEKILWFKRKKKIVIWKGSYELKYSLAEMMVEAVFDVLSCKSIGELNHIIMSQWGYKPYNCKGNYSEIYPDFFKEDFETFYTKYYQKHNKSNKV